MHTWRRLYVSWRGGRVHPARLGFETVAALSGLWPLLMLIPVFLARLTYPMDLEWCEGGMLYQAYRLLHGLPVYARNDPIWTPWSYPIGHTLALALIGLFKCDFWTGRLLSIAFFGALCAALFREVYSHLEGSSFGVALGALTVGIVACAYPVVGQWYDLIRVDMMAIAFSVIAVARLNRFKPSWKYDLTTAALLTTSVYSKQTAVFFVAWACSFAFARDPRRGLRLAIMTGSMCLLALGILQLATDGSYWFWTVTDLAGQAVDDARLIDALRQLSAFAPFVLAVPLVFLMMVVRGLASSRTVLWFGAFVMSVPASLLPYAKAGGYNNNLIPMITVLAIVVAMLAADLAKLGSVLGTLARWGALAGIGAFVWARPLKPSEYVPNQRDRRAAAELNALVASLDGGVVAPELGFLPTRTGHTNPHWYTMAMWCAFLSKRPMDMGLAVESSGARWALLQSRAQDDFAFYIRRRFRLSRAIPPSARVRMLTGNPVFLDELWEKSQAN